LLSACVPNGAQADFFIAVGYMVSGMEYLKNGFTLDICEGGFPLSTDSIALSDFVKLPRGAKVLDLGAGCGTLGVLLCAKNDDCTVTGVELDPAAHSAALENAQRNGLDARFTSICADLRTLSSVAAPGSFSVCVSNPPYFSGGPESRTVPLARKDDHCSAEELFAAAAYSLKYGGDFFLVHKPEKLAQLCGCAVKYALEPKRLCLLRHKADGPVTLILLACRKGGKPGLVWEEAALYDHTGAPTDYYRKLYHQEES